MNPLRLSVYLLGINVLWLIPQSGSAQLPDSIIYTVVECQPEFPGGIGALTDYLNAHVHYPSEAQKARIKGRVFVSFVVEPDGQITRIYLFKELGYGCDEEAIRVVKAMPRWIPGSQAGQPIRVNYKLPVLFSPDNRKRKGD